MLLNEIKVGKTYYFNAVRLLHKKTTKKQQQINKFFVVQKLANSNVMASCNGLPVMEYAKQSYGRWTAEIPELIK